MRNLTIVESVSTPLDISRVEAAGLRGLGRRLAGSKEFWGTAAQEVSDTALNLEDERSVIKCIPREDGRYTVTVSEAIGIVAMQDLVLVVNPKIPWDHFRYLLVRSSSFPRFADDPLTAAADESLWELVTQWFVTALERVLRAGLLSDYEERSELLSVARGQIRPTETALEYYQGNVALACDYEEFDVDSPLNRVLRAAALCIARAPVLTNELRWKARRALRRLDHIGDLREGDLLVEVDRRSAFYADALLLARHVLSATGRRTEQGSERAWSFLVRTPDLVEEAIRNILADGLSDLLKVWKHRMYLGASGLHLSPDLIFGQIAVGDVKYRLSRPEWVRSDIYQLTTFATAFERRHAGLFSFVIEGAEDLLPIKLGSVSLRSFHWDASPLADPHTSAGSIVRGASDWLRTASSASASVVAGDS